MIRLLLADDHRLVREGLRALLERAGFEVVAEAGDGYQAVELAASLRPEVAVLDLAMPGLNGLEALERLRQASPKTKVLILSMFDDELYILRAARAGAAGYLLKDGSSEELREAIDSVCNSDRFYLGRGITSERLRRLVANAKEGPRQEAEFLTAREREVLALIARGLSTDEIARKLGLSPKTIAAHRAKLRAKLGVHTPAGLARYALLKLAGPGAESPAPQGGGDGRRRLR
ncbi:MAG: response regulator transcription factor [Candidatus Acetothermia bacterium]|jgi:DNA-binding NarL/FixJ family response regulator|nr:response regulator transcription factor [Candidatus Acetothermia bacterium]MDH7505759.1 response regulator transcription factor [Candidatus Acetothermia bacterium]